MKTYHLLISGKVQGVFYRNSAREIANELDVKGWIRNTKDDRVEALVSGSAKNVEKFIEWCKKGPSQATVSDVYSKEHFALKFQDFEILK